MGQVLHPNAVTTHAIRKEIQEAPSSVLRSRIIKALRIRLAKQFRNGVGGVLLKIAVLALKSLGQRV